MTEALLHWLIRSSLLLTLSLLIILLARRVVRSILGSRVTYALWLLLVPAVLPPVPLPGTLPALSSTRIVSDLTVATQAVIPEAPAIVTASLLVVSIWLAGVIATWGLFLGRQYRFGRRLRSASVDHAGAPLVQHLRKQGLPKWVQIRLSPAVTSPVIVGCLPPHLYLPRDVEQPDAVLAHEVAHIRHGDPAWSLLFVVLRGLFWFLPWVHQACKPFQTDQELAADETVLCRLDESQRYRYGCLLARTAGIDHPVAAQAWSGQSQLKERIRMIGYETRSPLMVKTGLALVFSALLATTWGIAGTESEESRLQQNRLETFDIEPIVRIPPKYPRQAAENGVSGHVVLEGLLTRDGDVTAIEIIESEPQGVFDAVAAEAFSKWKYSPDVAERVQSGEQKVRTMIEFEVE